MATTTILPAPTEPRISGEVTAHHTITVEPYTDIHCAEVHEAVVERFRGVLVCVCCRDVDVLRNASLDDVARAYARMYEADYVASVTR